MVNRIATFTDCFVPSFLFITILFFTLSMSEQKFMLFSVSFFYVGSLKCNFLLFSCWCSRLAIAKMPAIQSHQIQRVTWIKVAVAQAALVHHRRLAAAAVVVIAAVVAVAIQNRWTQNQKTASSTWPNGIGWLALCAFYLSPTLVISAIWKHGSIHRSMRKKWVISF